MKTRIYDFTKDRAVYIPLFGGVGLIAFAKWQTFCLGVEFMPRGVCFFAGPFTLAVCFMALIDIDEKETTQ